MSSQHMTERLYSLSIHAGQSQTGLYSPRLSDIQDAIKDKATSRDAVVWMDERHAILVKGMTLQRLKRAADAFPDQDSKTHRILAASIDRALTTGTP